MGPPPPDPGQAHTGPLTMKRGVSLSVIHDGPTTMAPAATSQITGQPADPSYQSEVGRACRINQPVSGQRSRPRQFPTAGSH